MLITMAQEPVAKLTSVILMCRNSRIRNCQRITTVVIALLRDEEIIISYEICLACQLYCRILIILVKILGNFAHRQTSRHVNQSLCT